MVIKFAILGLFRSFECSPDMPILYGGYVNGFISWDAPPFVCLIVRASVKVCRVGCESETSWGSLIANSAQSWAKLFYNDRQFPQNIYGKRRFGSLMSPRHPTQGVVLKHEA